MAFLKIIFLLSVIFCLGSCENVAQIKESASFKNTFGVSASLKLPLKLGAPVHLPGPFALLGGGGLQKSMQGVHSLMADLSKESAAIALFAKFLLPVAHLLHISGLPFLAAANNNGSSVTATPTTFLPALSAILKKLLNYVLIGVELIVGILPGLNLLLVPIVEVLRRFVINKLL